MATILIVVEKDSDLPTVYETAEEAIEAATKLIDEDINRKIIVVEPMLIMGKTHFPKKESPNVPSQN